MKYHLIGVGAKAILNENICETQDEAQHAKEDSNGYFQLSI